MIYAVLYLNTFLFIALRAFQQLNVSHDRYLWIPPVSMAMAVCEIVTITKVVALGSYWAAIPMGVGGFTGSWFAMWLHKRLRKE